MNWIKLQNEFSHKNRGIFEEFERHPYYKNNVKCYYYMGCFRYTVDCQLNIDGLKKELSSDGINGDGNGYFWHYFYDACSFVKSDCRWCLSIKENSIKVPKIKTGKWKYNKKVFDNIVGYINKVKKKHMKYRRMLVYFPFNHIIEKNAKYKYNSYFINELKRENITFVGGNIDKIVDSSSNLLIIVIDIITDKNRLINVVNDIRNKSGNKFPLLSYFSLMKIYDEDDCNFCKAITFEPHLKECPPYSVRCVRNIASSRNSDYTDEEIVMRSLMGLGPDPEKLGF